MRLTKQEIGSILKQLREANGYTQKEVAEHFGRKQQIVGHWETGYAQPDAGTLFELCDFYGADISKAFGFLGKSNKAEVKIPDNLDEQDICIARAYHAADADDRAVVEAALRKYIATDGLRDGQKMA
ncbi:Helix-turn-helix domain protein [anaerobic digester metagenome]|jgi:transcriptional regulator with XRE-family HTH domain|uniref:helix-turn-helix domain-containing protein n=1 Tax=Oscillibacter ruminantium TaxID=1263547 RepID=UPI00332F380D